jgi:hypothetical protein
MSAPPGSAASSSIEAPHHVPISASANRQPLPGYLQQLALRQDAAEIRRLIVYGLTIGWILSLVAGFLFFCVKSRFDWLWCGLMLLGLLHLSAAVVLPQSLIWPERIWMTIARGMGHLATTILLTAVYFLLFWPASWFSKKHIRGFYHWTDQQPTTTTSWHLIDVAVDETSAALDARYRSLPIILAGVVSFFLHRGNYILLAIIVLLIILGLVLFVVENSVIAPFIYPLF